MSAINYHVLLCDDDQSLVSLLADSLRERHFTADIAYDGQEAAEKLEVNHYDIMVMDLSMPRLSGFEFLDKIHPLYPNLPIIVLSSHTDQADMVEAFRLGCDDYLTKPFSVQILICHMLAVLRRFNRTQENKETVFKFGSMTLDTANQTLNGQHIPSKVTELLALLAAEPSTLVDRSYIMRTVWGKEDAFTSRSLSVFIHNIRPMVAPAGYQIISVRGKGYKLVKR